MSEPDFLAPKGIGGWLILVVINLIVSPIRAAYVILDSYWPIFHNGTWQGLTSPESYSYHPLWTPLLIFGIVGNFIIVALGIATLVLLVRRSHYTPTFAIAWIGWTAIFIIADHFGADLVTTIAEQSNSSPDTEIFRSVIFAGIWIPYFLVSKRVKATFVE